MSFTRFAVALTLAWQTSANIDSWRKLLDQYKYEWDVEEVTTHRHDYKLHCIKVKWNIRDHKPALEGIMPWATMTTYQGEMNDEEWARHYWKGPIILMHGFNGNADDWINENQGPHTVLPLVLADLGYEVWVCNNRGVFDYSGHTTYDPNKDDAYWDYDWLDMASEDLSQMTGALYNKQVAPAGTTDRKPVTFIGVQSATTQILDSLVRHEDPISIILEKAILMAPTLWMELPGPSFTDPVMDQIKNLSPPQVGGNDWLERRIKICTISGNAQLCQHPFMATNLSQPISIKEWELLQQWSEAKRFQERIPRKDHTQKGQQSAEIDIKKIHGMVETFILNPEKGGDMDTNMARWLAKTIQSKNIQVEEGMTHWKDFYSKPHIYFVHLAQALGIDLLSLKRRSGKDSGFVMEGGVVEADVAVIEGIAVDAELGEPRPDKGTAIELKEEHPPKVKPGDQPPKVAPGDQPPQATETRTEL